MAIEAVPMEVFDGVMLSDGSLRFSERSVNAWLSINLSGSCHMDWLKGIKESLVRLGVPVYPRGLRLFKGVSKSKEYVGAYLQSSSQPFLTEQFSRWYKNGVKSTPEDVNVTPASVANWFMGDGSSSPDNRNDAIVTYFACCKFSIDECNMLVKKLESIGVVATAAPCSGYPRINISQYSVNYFMDMIEDYIFPSFNYKIKRRCSRPAKACRKGVQVCR